MTALDPPPGMPADRQAIWRQTLADLAEAGTLFRLDLNSLAAYVAAVAQHRRATELLEQSDVLLDREGRPVANPLLTVQAQQAQVVAAFARQFGLTRHRAPGHAIDAGDAKEGAPGHPRPPGEQGYWCEQHKRWECTGNKHGGTRCHKIRLVGMPHCGLHVGRGGPVKAVAARRPLDVEPLDMSPGEALLWRVRYIAAEVKALDAIVGGLEAEQVVWGREREVTRDAGEFPGTEVVYSAKLNLWVQYRQQRERALIDACADAMRANVDERLVRMAEMQGGRIVTALNGIFEDLALTAEQRERLPEVVPRRIRELVA